MNALLRFGPFVVYAGLVALATWFLYHRLETGAHTRATIAINKNHQVKATDIESADKGDIVGKYAKRDILKNDLIIPEDVGGEATLPVENRLEVVLSLDQTKQGALLTNGVMIQACINHKPLGKPASAVRKICDEKTCEVTLPLDGLPKSLELSSFELTAVGAGEPCDDKSPLIVPPD